MRACVGERITKGEAAYYRVGGGAVNWATSGRRRQKGEERRRICERPPISFMGWDGMGWTNGWMG